MKVLQKSDIVKYLKIREGEQKAGECFRLLSEPNAEALNRTPGKFVVFGIPEDFGVRGNLGVEGARNAWKYFLGAFLNVQSNRFFNGNDVILAGAFDFTSLYTDINNETTPGVYREKTEKVDKVVSAWVRAVKEAGKIPIAIGGGHNNAFGLLKGCALAAKKPLNTVNCDPHSDFRKLEGRHSGNGFSYAYHQNYLKKYAVVALHEGYNAESNLTSMEMTCGDVHFSFFEDIFIRQKLTLPHAFEQAYQHVRENYGIELDLDAVKNTPVSALTSSGLTPEQARSYVHFFASKGIPEYLHLCEAAPENLPQPPALTGKLLAYLTCDFINAVNAQLGNND